MQEKKSKIRNNKHLDYGITFIALILTIIALIVIIILISTTSSERKINKETSKFIYAKRWNKRI